MRDRGWGPSWVGDLFSIYIFSDFLLTVCKIYLLKVNFFLYSLKSDVKDEVTSLYYNLANYIKQSTLLNYTEEKLKRKD